MKNNKNKITNNQKLLDRFFLAFLVIIFLLNHRNWSETYGNIVYILAAVFALSIVIVKIVRRKKTKKDEENNV